jgi:short-subunit dehydrogenase
MNTRKSGKTALITGASAGIGHDLAKVFARHGHDVILVARRKQKLLALSRTLGKQYGIQAVPIAMDLAAYGAAEALHEAVIGEGMSVGLLVNNAGVAFSGRYRNMKPQQISTLLQLNIVNLAEMTRLFLPAMVSAGHGRIMNLASIAAFQPLPLMTLYAASKAFVLSFSEGLGAELAGTGVTVTALCPGFTDTEMLEKGEQKTGRNEVFRALMVMPPERVAEEGYAAMMRGDPVHVTGVGNKGLTTLTQLAPRWAIRGLGALAARERG